MSSPRRFAALAVGLCTATTLAPLTLSPAGAEGSPPLHLSATSGPVGTRITVSGEGCVPRDDTPAVNVSLRAHQEFGDSPGTPVEPDGNGSWSVQLTVPDYFPSGRAYLDAHCAPEGDLPSGYFTYETEFFTVTPARTAPPATPVPGRPITAG